MEMLIRPAQQEPAATQAKTGGRAATAESAGGVKHSFNNLLAFLLGGTAQQVTGTREIAAEPDPELADDGEGPVLGFGGDVLLLGVVHTPHELVPPAATVALSLGGDQLVPGITGDAGEQSKSGIETGVPLPALTDEDVLPGGMTPGTAQATPLDGQPALAHRGTRGAASQRPRQQRHGRTRDRRLEEPRDIRCGP